MAKGERRKYGKGDVKMKIPGYLKNNVKRYEEKELAIMMICSRTGNDLLEVWYYGDFFMVSGEERNYIVGTDFAPEKIVAKDPETNEEILIFDGTVHGYDNMFCDVYTEEQINDRELKKLDIPASQLILELGYSIDYEDEKDDYDFDENGEVILVNGNKMSWDDVVLNGFDYLALSYIDKNGKKIQFVDCELA